MGIRLGEGGSVGGRPGYLGSRKVGRGAQWVQEATFGVTGCQWL